MTYYVQRKSVINRKPQMIDTQYGTQREMEKQFHLYCANACDGEQYPYDIDSIEWGTVEGVVIESKVYIKSELEEP